jgi:DNA-binding response OmpR family regulator
MIGINKRVLLVEDDIDYKYKMELYLESFGFKVISAESQKKGEELLQKEKIDLAIFDLMMENEDSGFILSHKSKQLNPNVPVIIATAVGAETGMLFNIETQEDKSWLGADVILEKGIRKDQLHREISKLLKL